MLTRHERDPSERPIARSRMHASSQQAIAPCPNRRRAQGATARRPAERHGVLAKRCPRTPTAARERRVRERRDAPARARRRRSERAARRDRRRGKRPRNGEGPPPRRTRQAGGKAPSRPPGQASAEAHRAGRSAAPRSAPQGRTAGPAPTAGLRGRERPPRARSAARRRRADRLRGRARRRAREGRALAGERLLKDVLSRLPLRPTSARVCRRARLCEAVMTLRRARLVRGRDLYTAATPSFRDSGRGRRGTQLRIDVRSAGANRPHQAVAPSS